MASAGKITLASRQSPLAMRQSETVAAALQKRLGISVDIIGITSRGDEITDRPLAAVGGKALFVKRLQEAIAAGNADAAVHSLKDMEAKPTPGFTLAAVGFAADCRDAVVHPGGGTLADLPPAAVVGTCSPRRGALLKRYFPALTAKPVRGNLQTRLKKLHAGDFDALLLAAAGLQRLELPLPTNAALPLEQFIPAVGQGLLGLECAADNSAIISLLAAVDDEQMRQRAIAERTFAAAMEGDCHTALGAHATVDHKQIGIHAFYADDNGGFYQAHVRAASAAAAGASAAADIRRQCARPH